MTNEMGEVPNVAAIPENVSRPSPAKVAGSPAGSDHSLPSLDDRDGHPIEQMTQDNSEPTVGRAFYAKEAWNKPKVNIGRLAAVFLVSPISL